MTQPLRGGGSAQDYARLIGITRVFTGSKSALTGRDISLHGSHIRIEQGG